MSIIRDTKYQAHRVYRNRRQQIIGHASFGRFLQVCVFKHSLYPAQGHSGTSDFYFKLLSTTNTPTPAIIFSIAYLTKLRQSNLPLLNEFPGTLIYTACLMLACNILDDAPYDTDSWATLSGHPSRLINQVSRRVALSLDYRLQMSCDDYSKFESFVMSYFTKPSPNMPSTRFQKSKLPACHYAC